MKLSGHLADLGLGEILNVVGAARRSGMLRLCMDTLDAVLVFRAGTVVGLQHPDVPATPDELATRAGASQPTDPAAIEWLIERIESVTHSLLSERHGTFEFVLVDNRADLSADHRILLLDEGTTTNAYLQGSWRGTPIERGITLVNEARAAGVRVCFATDNVADSFYPYGGYDLLDTFEKAVILAHLKAPQGWLDAVSTAPAAAMGLDRGDPFAVGAPADWLLFGARDMAELLSPDGRAPAGRILIRQGEIVDVSA